MEYQATFGIDGGVSHGFGIVYSDYVREQKVIFADSHQVAYQNAMSMAGKFADDYLSNPDSGFTTVQLLSLRSPDEDISFDVSKSVVKRSWVDHVARIASLEDKIAREKAHFVNLLAFGS
ncbi:hypothetical protein HYV79_01275 [Candidatus Woesearchaeota archaeon]|nr:hypothetical protein [Candidatus Woesearchaeota archaeon]